MNKNVNENLRSVDQYEILRELGRGGTSIVYLVADRADGKNYAMKVLRRDDGSNPEDLQEAAEQLWAEAAVLELLGRDPQKQAARDSQKQAGRDPQKQTGSGTGKSTLEKSSREKRDIERQDIEKSGCEERIRGKGNPTFIECVSDESGDFAGFVMEYVEGRSLQQILEEGKQYSIREAAEAGTQLCAILGRLHRMNPPMIYRDLKPANILARPDGSWVVVDFGAVRKYREGAGKDTSRLGTEGYAHYYVGGHSLGGAMAGSFAAGHAEELDGLVLLASYATSDLSESGLAVLSAYGSEDGVLNRESYAKNYGHLPADTQELVIAGGNHAQFGDYGAQAGDGTAQISAEEQQALTAEAIAALAQ